MDLDLNLIEEDINQMRLSNTNNEDILLFLSQVYGVDNKHDYLMVTNVDYRRQHQNKNYNCDICQSINISNIDGLYICTNCGSVLGYNYVLTYNDMECYTKHNNIYKRRTYIKTIINEKLSDLPQVDKEKIIKLSYKIFTEFNKINLNKRKSFFSYSYMFRYILKKLELNNYIDKFKPLKIKHVLAANEEFYNKLKI